MKKNIILITIIITLSCYLNAMEPKTAPCFFKGMPVDVLNFIASLLTFDDIESEQEFINREKRPSTHPDMDMPPYKEELFYTFADDKDYSTEVSITSITIVPNYPKSLIKKLLNNRTTPFTWLKENKNIIYEERIHLAVYSPNNLICAITYLGPISDTGTTYNLSIVNTQTNKELHHVCLKINRQEKDYEHLAISSSGNIFATIYCKKINDTIGWKNFIKIKNLRTQKKERPDCPTDWNWGYTIAFNKQGTHLITHDNTWDSADGPVTTVHKIIPLTTTLDNLNDDAPQKKTLPDYFAQKMICKNFMLQLNNTLS